ALRALREKSLLLFEFDDAQLHERSQEFREISHIGWRGGIAGRPGMRDQTPSNRLFIKAALVGPGSRGLSISFGCHVKTSPGHCASLQFPGHGVGPGDALRQSGGSRTGMREHWPAALLSCDY